MPSRQADELRAHPTYVHSKDTDFTSLQQVPDSYAWTPLDDDGNYKPNATVSASNQPPPSVPVIDLTDANAVKLIGHACKNLGAFQITNHGVPLNLLDDIESMGRKLFSLPGQQKLKAARGSDGITGYGVARIASFFSKRMWSEGFTIMGSPEEHARQLWPEDDDHKQFCKVIEEYEKEMKNLAAKLVWLMLGSLGITREDIQWAGPNGDFQGANAALQLNSYPACPDPDRAMGLAAHTDSTLLTILYQNSTSGLQVFREETGWITVPPIPGALIVNVGDLFTILSNGLYPSVVHRAMVNRTKQRMSVAYLYGPPGNSQIGPSPKLVGPGQPPLYRAVTWTEYLGTKAKLFNKGLLSVRL